MTEELSRLEVRLDELGRTVDALRVRLEAVEAQLQDTAAEDEPESPPQAMSPATTVEEPATAPPEPVVPAPLRILALVGRTLMALGGAYLLRALTEAGHVPEAPGVALGFAYAVVWVVLAERDALAGRRRSAAFHGTAAALIAYPLIWETLVRFEIFEPPVGALLLGVVGGLLLAGAWRHRLQPVAWLGAGGAILAAWALALALSAWLLFAAVVVALGVAAWWLDVANRWRGLAWVAALASDLTVLGALLLAHRDGAPPEALVGLGVALLAGYVGSFLLRLRVHLDGHTMCFAVTQTVLVLVTGYLPVVLVLRTDGPWATGLGALSLLAGLLLYGMALSATGGAAAERRGRFEAGVGLALALAGTSLLLAPTPLALTLAVAAVGAALLAGRRLGLGLPAHAAVYATVAAATSGLLLTAIHTLAVPAGVAWPALDSIALLVLLGGVSAFGVLVARGSEPRGRGVLSRLLLLALLVLTAGGVLVYGLAPLLAGGTGGSAAAGPLAALRTAVLALAAVALAALGRGLGWREASWLVTPVLVLGAIKLLGEDFPRSGPGMLFVALAVYGAALIAVARLGRHPRHPPPDDAEPAAGTAGDG